MNYVDTLSIGTVERDGVELQCDVASECDSILLTVDDEDLEGFAVAIMDTEKATALRDWLNEVLG